MLQAVGTAVLLVVTPLDAASQKTPPPKTAPQKTDQRVNANAATLADFLKRVETRPLDRYLVRRIAEVLELPS